MGETQEYLRGYSAGMEAVTRRHAKAQETSVETCVRETQDAVKRVIDRLGSLPELTEAHDALTRLLVRAGAERLEPPHDH